MRRASSRRVRLSHGAKVLRMAHHCYVLENGRIAFDAPASELLHDPRIEKTYLGAGH